MRFSPMVLLRGSRRAGLRQLSALGAAPCVLLVAGSAAPRSFPAATIFTKRDGLRISMGCNVSARIEQRRMSSQTSTGVKVLQELPSKKFWNNDFEDLTSVTGANSDAKVSKWVKKPRDAVANGDLLFEFEVGGQMTIEMRAETKGFMGPQFVQEGEMVEEGNIATYITDEREALPEVSRETEAELLDRAGGSVRDLKLSLEDIEAKRGSAKGDLAAAMRLMSLHLKCSPAVSVGAVRVPGASGGGSGEFKLFVTPFSSYPQEVTKDTLVEVDSSSLCEAGNKIARLQDVLFTAMSSHPSADVCIIAQPPNATALTMTPGGLPGDIPRCNPVHVLEGGACGVGCGDIVSLPGFGVIIWGTTVASAYCRLWELERRSALTLKAMQAGVAIENVTQALPALKSEEAAVHFSALKRILTRGDNHPLPPL